MKKDVIIAIIIGFVLGGLSAIFVTNLPNLIKAGKDSTKREVSISPTPIFKMGSESGFLTIQNPTDRTLSETKNIELNGKTKPGAIVLLENDLDSKVIEVSSDGSFTNKLTLSEGANLINITSYNENGVGDSKNLTVYYTSEKL